MRRQRGRIGLMAAALVGVLTSAAVADVTTEQSSSILVFPKVIADGTRDTIIQITNTSNSMVHAHCFYVNAASVFGGPIGPGNPPQWQEIDFDIWLTKQQPTHWVVSEGRLVNPADQRCSQNFHACNNAGFDPGRVPPQVEDFTGELKCVEVDASGAPMPGDHFKGEATIVAVDRCENFVTDDAALECASDTTVACTSQFDCPGTTGDVAKYNALGIKGRESANEDSVLCLGAEDTPPADGCQSGNEYNGCPDTWILNHFVDGVEDPVLGDGSEVNTFITVVPCAENFESQEPTSVVIQFEVFDEFESPFSASTTVTCWAELQLSDISNVFERQPFGPLERTFAQTRMRPSRATDSGFLVVAEEVHTTAGGTDSASSEAAFNLIAEGERRGPDRITIPADQLRPQEP